MLLQAFTSQIFNICNISARHIFELYEVSSNKVLIAPSLLSVFGILEWEGVWVNSDVLQLYV